jgi:hypothetical protein
MYDYQKIWNLINIIRIWVSTVDTLWTVLMSTVSEVEYPVLIKLRTITQTTIPESAYPLSTNWILFRTGQGTLQQESPDECHRISCKALVVIFVSVFNDVILTSICHAVKAPFLRYQLAMGVMQHSAESRVKPYLQTERLLTPEGLGLPDRIFSNLQVTVPLFSHWITCLMNETQHTEWLTHSLMRHFVGFVADKVALGKGFSEYFGFPCQSSLHQFLHNTITHHPGLVQ